MAPVPEDMGKTKSITSVKLKTTTQTAITKSDKGKKPTEYLRIKCPICFENIIKDRVSSTRCGHVFCTNCLRKVMRRQALCPTCRTKLRGIGGYHRLYLDTCMELTTEVNSKSDLKANHNISESA